MLKYLLIYTLIFVPVLGLWAKMSIGVIIISILLFSYLSFVFFDAYEMPKLFANWDKIKSDDSDPRGPKGY